jgi:hypothetical protein
MTALEGSLEVFALPDVFRLLGQNKVTGALEVARESGDGTVFFREGEVYYAFSSLTREFLGQRLVNAKLITQGQLLRILDEQKRSGTKKVGDILIEKGILSEELLETFLKEQIQDAIFNLLQWDAGQFSFSPGEVSNQEVGLSVSVENLIMESSRRIEEWEVIQRKIPSMDVVLRMAPTPPEDSVEINIKPDEWTLLVLADGTRTVRDVAAASERSEFEACKILYGLVTAGLLDVTSGPPSHMPRHAPPLAEPAVEAPAPSAPVLEERPPEHLPPEVPQPAATAEETYQEAPVSEPAPEPVMAPGPVAEPKVAVDEPPPETAVPAEPPAPAPAEDAAFAGNGSTNREAPAPRKGDPTVTKELLLKLISGVRNL